MKKIGIGYESYKRMIDDGCYYVDKTLLVRDIVEKGGMVTLFIRPRRFGKTLALSMLQTYFEDEIDADGNHVDNRHYFEGMRIMDKDPEILSMQGKYPVIRLSLKSARKPDFRSAFLKLREEIISECVRHDYLLKSDRLSQVEKDRLNTLLSPVKEEDLSDRNLLALEISRYATALKILSLCLNKYHGKKVIILLDEYDVPLEHACYHGFYQEMMDYIRSLFESALKTNDALEFAVVTGCLRISRESIFTGLNHLEISTIMM